MVHLSIAMHFWEDDEWHSGDMCAKSLPPAWCEAMGCSEEEVRSRKCWLGMYCTMLAHAGLLFLHVYACVRVCVAAVVIDYRLLAVLACSWSDPATR